MLIKLFDRGLSSSFRRQLHLLPSDGHIFQLFIVGQTFSFINFQLGDKFRPLLGKLLHFFGFDGDQGVKLIDFTEPLDESYQ